MQAQFKKDHETWENKIKELDELYSTAISDWEQEVAILTQEIEHQRQAWEETVEKIRQCNAEKTKKYEQVIAKWEEEKHEFELRVDQLRTRYYAGDPDAITTYISIALAQSPFPAYFPDAIDIHYNPQNRLLLVDRGLPSPGMLPRINKVTYVQTRDAFDEKPLSKTAIEQLYNSLVYQTALRTIHEIFSADTEGHIIGVVFNGWVEAVDPATGHKTQSCIASMHANREEFIELDLKQVDPKACFRKLKGVAAAKLHQLTPVAPLMKFNKKDKRFIEGREVSKGLNATVNLATMDWEDFEHLVRELFEEEFGHDNAKVKITRASRDRGVDAIAFDPDPIKGGKFVIQAKRYTHTVGVDAVRDLYGTVINEGANKGILVTTSDFGPDAYEFVKDKPLTLVNGGGLLFLLEKHGHKARIDLAEARSLNVQKKLKENSIL